MVRGVLDTLKTIRCLPETEEQTNAPRARAVNGASPGASPERAGRLSKGDRFCFDWRDRKHPDFGESSRAKVCGTNQT